MTVCLDDLKDDGCLWCGAEIPMTGARSYLRQFCGVRCKNAFHNNLRKVAQLEAMEKWDRRCPHCDAPIASAKPAHTIYCSASCKRAVAHARWRARSRLVCLRCNQPFTCSTGSRRYCSSECRTDALRDKKDGRFGLIEPRRPVPCRWCGTMFTPARRPPLQVLCSSACRSAELAAKRKDWPQRFTRICRACSGTFLSRNNRRKYCSEACAATRWPQPREERPCVICSALFRPNRIGRPRVSCSTSCAGLLAWQHRRPAFQCEAVP